MLGIMREGLSISDTDHDAMLDELIQNGQVVIAGSMGRARSDEAPAAADGSLGAGQYPPPPILGAEPSYGGGFPPAPVSPPPAAALSPQASPSASPVPTPPIPAPKLYTPPQGPAEQAPPPSQKQSLLSGPVEPLKRVIPPPAEAGGVSRISPHPIPPRADALNAPAKFVKCTRCGELIPISTEERPIQLICPKCGFSGTLKK